jgi:hypothetical protein
VYDSCAGIDLEREREKKLYALKSTVVPRGRHLLEN